jgi:alkylhydroperoxidase family enzyme
MHIAPKEISKYPWYLRILYKSQKKKLGQTLLPGLFWGRMPTLQILFILFWSYLDRKNSSLPGDLRALVQVRVAQINWCKFCIDYNALNLLNRTNSMHKVKVLEEWRTELVFSKLEKSALEYTEILSNKEVIVSDSTMDELKNHFNDDQIVELTALISFQNMSAKFNAGLNIPSQGLCELPTSEAQKNGD